jgi:hypothetical protein
MTAHCEHCRVYTYADCQARNRDRRKSRMFHKHPNRETGVLKSGLKKSKHVDFARTLFEESWIPKATLCI